ncbi:MAG TPA: VWA domain-containing protein [Polyangiaceae bacterium]|nr:VWA domain-containing protein [Polyangiaceae bacterium]
MNFLVPLALGLGALILVPILAHALFRGPVRPLAFPAARFVPAAVATTQRRNRIEDRALLSLRVLLLLALALLGSSPFVRCSRLSLARPDGASLAVALVIDDSASMNVRDGNITRLSRALDGARQVLDSARADDTFSLVLAGKPARLLAPATARHDTLRELLGHIEPTDRASDLTGALELAQASLAELPQPTRRTLVLGDMQSEAPLTPELLAGVSAPLAELRQPFSNCALGTGQLAGSLVRVEISCTEHAKPSDRVLRVHALTDDDSLGDELGRTNAREGVTTIQLGREPARNVRLIAVLAPDSEHDQLESDDRTELLRDDDAPVVAVRADAERAGTSTGSTTVIELGLRSVDPRARIEPLSIVPDSAAGFSRFAALIIDDPPGFTPETQEALQAFLDDEGVVLLLLGPRAASAPLASGWWPLLSRSPEWVPATAPDATAPNPVASPAPSPAGAEPIWQTWSELDAARRARVELRPEDHVLRSFADGAPLWIERRQGRGLTWILTLPASVDASDLALRPAFLALLDRVLEEASLRRGSRPSPVGQRWRLAPDVRVRGPRGPLSPTTNADGAYFEPAWTGRYTLEHPNAKGPARVAHRYATRDVQEGLLQPGAAPPTSAASVGATADAPTPLARPLALLVLGLVAAELVLRSLSRRNPGASPAESPGPVASSIPPA